ncbi:hypothetical protein [Sporosarcina sp. HYO08]|uniref:hypothetical protein n=1 Tax=Sporosarcina sp. HYO08 TaxID=1759557 RepID=UPI00079494D1|nr:hypothetical protein [Sporosarcina sp. HYO08]KXH80935.1 hypothetical protein AU377_09390 [Sporosarcina sp. HYO08]
MPKGWLFIIGIVATALASLYFIVKLNLHYAVLSMTALFTLTNASRVKRFREQGMEREAKWMRSMAFFFGIACIVYFFIIILG